MIGGFILGPVLLRHIVRWLARLTSTPIDEQLLAAFGTPLSWLVFLAALHYATVRLSVLGLSVKRLLLDAYYFAALLTVAVAAWRAVDVLDAWLRHRMETQIRLAEAEPAIVLTTRIARIVVAIVAVSALLTHFGVNVPALAAAVGLSGLALSLAARDTLADGIAGIIILFDRPFRAGDRIEIQVIDTWGDVVNIGLRTTRIRTRDNRKVLVPNSLISSNQVVDYTYPDPRYRIQVHVGIAYGTDIEMVCQLLEETTRGVEGVLKASRLRRCTWRWAIRP
ncbi:MAG: mechanosensitive ion channel family protein [Anaerolineae bacterium]